MKCPYCDTEFDIETLTAYNSELKEDTGDDMTWEAPESGEWTEDEPVLVRVHSSCVTGDIFGSARCDCGEQLHRAMRMVEAEGKGVIL